jgi:diacylglycerol kinase family enzyme
LRRPRRPAKLEPMRRLLLISNANAHTVTTYRLEVIAAALSARFSLELVETKRRGHATEMARQAVDDGMDLVVALGGDGTVNEVANGLVGSNIPIAVLPGGMANVFARSLGVPADPIEATGLLLERVNSLARRVPLGRIDGRYFVANCGVGLDAAIVRAVEQRHRAKRRMGDLFFIWTGLRVFFFGYGRRKPHLEMSWGPDLQEHGDHLFLTIFQNINPYTYLGDRPMRVCPEADMDGGLDGFAVSTMRVRTILPTALRAFGAHPKMRGRRLLYVKDQPKFLVKCGRPMPLQMDGEFIGEREEILIESIPNALAVLA